MDLSPPKFTDIFRLATVLNIAVYEIARLYGVTWAEAGKKIRDAKVQLALIAED